MEMASTWSEIDALRHNTVAPLHIRYLEVFGEPSRSNHKQFLIRRIAWRLQGDLSERGRRSWRDRFEIRVVTRECQNQARF